MIKQVRTSHNIGMQMALPVFLLFSIYGVINTYLPLFLREMGYSISAVGTLLAIFEISGLVFPLLVSTRISKSGSYGKTALIYGVILTLLPIPLLVLRGYALTAVFLAVYAVGFKGAVPVTDAQVDYLLGENRNKYGKVRSMGSIGYVIMTVLLQFFGNLNSAPIAVRVLWVMIPGLLFTLSLVMQPALLINCRDAQEPVPQNVVVNTISPIKQFRVLFSEFNGTFWLGIVLLFTAYFGSVPAIRLLPLYVVDYLHIEQFTILWSLSAAAEIPFMFFSYRFLRKYKTMPVLLVCTAAVSVRNLMYVFFPSFAGVAAGQLWNAITYGLLHPAAILFVSENAPKKYMVIGMTLYSLVAVGLANIIGNAIGGFIIDSFGYTALFTFFAAAPVVGLIVFPFLRSRIEKNGSCK